MIVFRFLLFVILFGVGAFILYSIFYAIFQVLFVSKTKVAIAKLNKEYAINEEEADILIKEVIKKKSLKDKYAQMEADNKFFSEEQKKVKKVLEKKNNSKYKD